jgi:pimeloyl-ACP methyl ester carboxylesterase
MQTQTIATDSQFTGASSVPVNSTTMIWTGRLLSGLVVLFLTFDSIAKLLRAQPVIDATIQLGWPTGAIVGLGATLLSSVIVYLIPRTSLLGAVLLTGYLGGAVATHVRVGDPLFSHALFPVYVASFAWSGLVLRDARLRAFLRATFASARIREKMMSEVRSKDGTTIAFERSGAGPALILVDGAFCSRAFGPSPRLATHLARHCTVYSYDRRGRGASGDTQPYAPEREIEDIAALIDHAGGSASLLGLSSGAALALEAAASGLPIEKVIAYEPPYIDENGQGNGAAHQVHLERLLADGNRAGAVRYFMKDMVKVPAFVVAIMPLMPWVWRKLKVVAHTLPYDAATMRGFKVPRPRFVSIRVPSLVMHGSKTDDRLKLAAEAVASVIPGAQQRTLAGQTHNVNPTVLSSAAVEFLRASS